MHRKSIIVPTATLAVAAFFVIGIQFRLHAAAPQPPAYLPGGPLAGVELPLNPREEAADAGLPYHEFELYPGSVEHWRAYWTKYAPVRSFFDAQSQVKTWSAPDLAKLGKAKTEPYAEPIYKLFRDGTGPFTGKYQAPVPVVRCAVGKPILKLDLGTLDPGMYCLRIIGAVETKQLKPWRESLYVTWKLNDGPDGAVRSYQRRLGYVDTLYSVEELYFHVGQARVMQAELSVSDGSQVDLLVSNVSLDDALAGTALRAFKQRRTMTTDEEIATIKAQVTAEKRRALERDLAPTRQWTASDRLERDAAIWKQLPPVQVPYWGFGFTDLGYEETTPELSQEQFQAKYGAWSTDVIMPRIGIGTGYGFTFDPKYYHAFLTNRTLNVGYSIDDLWAGKPLPEPYPFPAIAGTYWADRKNSNRGHVVAPIPNAVYWGYVRSAPAIASVASSWWLSSGEEIFARDAAVSLIRYAYNYPAYDHGQELTSFLKTPSFRGRDTRFRQRHHYAVSDPGSALRAYDRLFPYLRGNEDLARSIQRFVPWVKTSEDLIALIDTYLVQTMAKRVLRYQYCSFATEILEPAVCLGSPEVTEPMMNWLFTRTFTYPLPLAGLQDLMIDGQDRLGVQYIGSTFYAGGEAASVMASELDKYRQAVGKTRYDLSDPRTYPKPLAACYWGLDITIGGQDFLRIGDVTGPEKAPGHLLRAHFVQNRLLASEGWRWSKDPKFAWLLKNMAGRKSESDAEWQEIESAAAKIKRAPWLDQPSRVVANWAGVLETGLPHDDFRYRRAAYVRAGIGYGHQHDDALDLQVFAHGLSMTPDAGQRSGYSKPNDRFTRLHNVVEVNGGRNTDEYGLRSYCWVRDLSDGDGARYLRAEALHPQAAVFYRQTSLIDVDEGQGSQPLSVQQQRPFAKLPEAPATANSYVFDVFRVRGGNRHTWCFHGPIPDEFQWNATGTAAPAKGSEDDKYLAMFSATPETYAAGSSPDILVATWRQGRAAEKMQLGENSSEALPRAYTRIHLLDAGGLRALRADLNCHQWNYRLTCLMAQKKGANLESAFPAIIEPYRGEPIVAATRLLSVEKNETDALRAVAVEVKTKNGHTDVCFADGRPDKIRQFSISNHQSQISAEFAYYSTDAQGLRQASLSGGTLLQTPGVTIKVAARERAGTVTRVDYPERALWIDARWPSVCAGRPFEIGNRDRRTSYTVRTLEAEGAGAKLVVRDGADFYRSPINQVNTESNRVDAVLTCLGFAGLRGGWTASNDQQTKTWKIIGIANGPKNSTEFTLDGPVSAADFAPSNAIRVWEYGVGDRLRQSTFVNVWRVEPGGYELQADTDVELTLNGKTHRVTVADLEKGHGRIRLPTGGR